MPFLSTSFIAKANSTTPEKVDCSEKQSLLGKSHETDCPRYSHPVDMRCHGSDDRLGCSRRLLFQLAWRWAAHDSRRTIRFVCRLFAGLVTFISFMELLLLCFC